MAGLPGKDGRGPLAPGGDVWHLKGRGRERAFLQKILTKKVGNLLTKPASSESVCMGANTGMYTSAQNTEHITYKSTTGSVETHTHTLVHIHETKTRNDNKWLSTLGSR